MYMGNIQTGSVHSKTIIVRPEELETFLELFTSHNTIRVPYVVLQSLHLPNGDDIVVDPETGFAFQTQNRNNQQNKYIYDKGSFKVLKSHSMYRPFLTEYQYVFLRSRGFIKIPSKWEVHHVNGIHTDNRPRNLVAVPPWLHNLLDRDLVGQIDSRSITLYEHSVMQKVIDIILKL
jgi:hypothetical protein